MQNCSAGFQCHADLHFPLCLARMLSVGAPQVGNLPVDRVERESYSQITVCMQTAELNMISNQT